MNSQNPELSGLDGQKTTVCFGVLFHFITLLLLLLLLLPLLLLLLILLLLLLLGVVVVQMFHSAMPDDASDPNFAAWRDAVLDLLQRV